MIVERTGGREGGGHDALLTNEAEDYLGSHNEKFPKFTFFPTLDIYCRVPHNFILANMELLSLIHI